jgi:hypothetical protein
MSTGVKGMSGRASEPGVEPPAPPEPASTPSSSGAAIAHAPLEAPASHVGDDETGLCRSILVSTAALLSGAEGGEALAVEGRVDEIRGLLEAHHFLPAEAACEASPADHPGHPESLGLRSVLVSR